MFRWRDCRAFRQIIRRMTNDRCTGSYVGRIAIELTLPYATHLVETSTTIITLTITSRTCHATGGHSWLSANDGRRISQALTSHPGMLNAPRENETTELTGCSQTEHHRRQTQTHHHKVEPNVVSRKDDPIRNAFELFSRPYLILRSRASTPAVLCRPRGLTRRIEGLRGKMRGMTLGGIAGGCRELIVRREVVCLCGLHSGAHRDSNAML